MNPRSLIYLQLFFLGIDLFSLNIIFLALTAYYNNNFVGEVYVKYISFELFLNLCWIGICIVKSLYHEKYIIPFEIFLKRSAYLYIYFIIVSIVFLYFTTQLPISRKFVVIFFTLFATSLIFSRLLYFLIYRSFKHKEYIVCRIIIIGYNSLAKKLADYLEKGYSKKVIGFCEEENNIKEISRYPILGPINSTIAACKKYEVNEIYSTVAPEANNDLYHLIREADLNCIRFKVVPDLNLVVNKYEKINYLYDLPIISLRSEPLDNLVYKVIKRFFDILFSFVIICFLLSWLLPIISLLIFLSSDGPIFFVQNRLGRNNKVFKMYKFRTMKCIEDDNGFKQAKENDDRVTVIGKFLRKTSLDELPQFLNVFVGQMSICGPRPHPLKLTEIYRSIIDKYMVRQLLKPGITGWAQVNGYRGETKTVEQMEGRIEHDIWYMKNWNFWLDIKIILLTLVRVLKGDKQAY